MADSDTGSFPLTQELTAVIEADDLPLYALHSDAAAGNQLYNLRGPARAAALAKWRADQSLGSDKEPASCM